MGCWNATCNISNLPIFYGEKVVLIPLVRTRETANSTNCCYPTDNFVPFGFPIFGEYDEYGGLNNPTTTKENENHLMNLKYFYAKKYEDKEFEEANKNNSFEDLVNNVLTCAEGCYLEEDVKTELHPKGMAEISYMMIHYDLYMTLINEIGNRIPYNNDRPYKELLMQKLKNKMAKHHQNYTNYSNIIIDLHDDKKTVATASYMKLYEMLEVKRNIFDRGIMLNTNKWTYFCQLMLDNPELDDEILEQTVNQIIFTDVLSFMRKGYHCDSGCGSQGQETRIHVILANYIIEHVKNLAKEYTEDSEDEIPSTGIEETLYFFD